MAYDESIVTRFDDETKELGGDYWLAPLQDASAPLSAVACTTQAGQLVSDL